MTNEELLAILKARLASGELNSAAVLELVGDSTTAPSGTEPSTPAARSGFSVTRLLYIVGGIFVTLGVLYLAAQIWGDLNTANRILITLGLGLVFAAMGSLLMLSAPERELGSVFHAIGGFLVPSGSMVTLVELTDSIDDIWPVTLTAGGVFLFYGLLVWFHRRVVLSFFAVLTGTGFGYLLLEALVPTAGGAQYAWLTMAFGMTYLMLAYGLAGGWNERLLPFLLFFGSGGFFLAGFSRIFDTTLMEYGFPLLAFGGLVVAVQVLRSRIVLLVSTLAVIAYIIYFTAEYFADSIGWPVALIGLGFVIIGIGYLSIRLNRKYLRQPAS
ncbi:MAG: hypothetical protein RLZZ385_1403 [Pseudomonadota bacterium]|jgi:hypothetical protein